MRTAGVHCRAHARSHSRADLHSGQLTAVWGGMVRRTPQSTHPSLTCESGLQVSLKCLSIGGEHQRVQTSMLALISSFVFQHRIDLQCSITDNALAGGVENTGLRCRTVAFNERVTKFPSYLRPLRSFCANCICSRTYETRGFPTIYYPSRDQHLAV